MLFRVLSATVMMIVLAGVAAAQVPAGNYEFLSPQTRAALARLKAGEHATADVPLTRSAGRAAAGRTRHRVAVYSRHAKQHSGFTEAQNRLIATHCVFGMPRIVSRTAEAPTRYVFRNGFVLEHSSLDKIPLWVCERVTRAQISGQSVGRSNRFFPEPQLEGFPRAELIDYRGSGFDRGHMAPAGNQVSDRRLKDETFSLANMSPQAPQLNQQIWRELEDTTREWARRWSPAYMITGNLFYDPAEDSPETADGIVNYSTIGPGEVAVPTHCYKIVIAREPRGRWRAIGFVMPNAGQSRPFRFQPYVRSIDWIEERSGLNFLPDLTAAEEAALEATEGLVADWPGDAN